MKINSLKNINFGYDPKYHAEVQDKLKNRKNNVLSAQYAALDFSANKIEDEIVELEKKGYIKSDKYKTMCDSVVNWRTNIALYVATHFQDLYYPDNLIYQYCDEMSSDIEAPKNDWRKKMCQSLRQYSIKFNNEPLPFEPNNIQKQTPKEPNNTTSQAQAKASVGSSFSIPAHELVVKFSPTSSSPKGFCDVYAMDDIKSKLNDEIIEYIKNPNLKQKDFEEYGIMPPSTFLFYGPPGFSNGNRSWYV